MFLNGMPLVESELFTKGTIKLPRRRNKSKRIQKKWNKKYGFNCISIPDTQIYIIDGKCIGHPKTLQKMIGLLGKGNSQDLYAENAKN